MEQEVKPNAILMIQNAITAQGILSDWIEDRWYELHRCHDEGDVVDLCKRVRQRGQFELATELRTAWETGKIIYKKEVAETRNNECVMATGFDTMNFKYGS